MAKAKKQGKNHFYGLLLHNVSLKKGLCRITIKGHGPGKMPWHQIWPAGRRLQIPDVVGSYKTLCKI